MFPTLLYLSAALLIAPQSNPQAAKTDSQTGTIEGRVLKAGTDEPLKKAWLWLERVDSARQSYASSTDASGRFVLKNVEPGRYMLWAERNGYARQAYGQRGSSSQGTTLTLAPGQSLGDIVIRLVPAAVVSGRVTDEDAEPVSGVAVQAMRYRYIKGRRELVPAGFDRTDDRGEYRVYGLPPGQYYVSATFGPWRGRAGSAFATQAGGESEESYPPTYYPGTNDPSRATLLELRAGEELGAIDFMLLPTQAVRVRGRVFNAITGEPGRGVTIFLLPRESGVRSFLMRNETRVEDAQGGFEIAGVIPGSYTLHAFWWDGDKQYSTQMPLEVGSSDLEGLNVVIGAGTRMAGRVRVEGEATFKLTELTVLLESQPEPQMMGPPSAKVKSDGSFEVASVSPGDYRVNLRGLPEDCYLKAARMGGDDVLDEEFKIRPEQAGESLELAISPAGGRVDGMVLNENQEPVTGAHVALVPDAPRREHTQLYKAATSDQYGRVTLRGLAPGEYKLFAWEEIEPGAYQDADFLKPYEDRGVPVRLQEGDRQPVQLQLIPAATPRD